MKKYITFITLLAAGTAFANAEEILLTLPSGKLCNPEGYLGNTAIGLLDHRIDESYGVYAGNSGGTVSWANTNTSGQEGYWTQTSETAGYITLAGRSGAGGENFALVLGSEIAVGTQIQSITLSYNVPANDVMAFDGKAMSFAIGYASGDAYKQKTDNHVVNLAKSTASEGTLTLMFTDVISWAAGDKIIVALAGPAVTPNTSVYNVEVKGVSYTIPEPSAFGLLAGLGALALVGARRRRR